MFVRSLVGALFILGALVQTAAGVELAPFPVRNLSPLAQVRALAVAEPARLNRPGQASARLDFEIANQATARKREDEAILLDGEIYATTLAVRYGFGKRLQFGLDLPWVSQRRGALDGFIRDWHDFFGLPNGDREKMPDHELNYYYRQGEVERLQFTEESSGPGDLRLRLSWQWLEDAGRAVSLAAQVKAPTGQAEKLTGSGGWDFALALSWQRDLFLGQEGVAVWSGLGANRLGAGGVLAGQAKEWAANAWLGAGWSPLAWLGLKLQLDGHTALYHSELQELGDPALILTLGGTLALGAETSLDLAIGEDLVVTASPDFSCHLSLSHRF